MHWVCSWGSALYYGDETGDEGKASARRVSQTLNNSTLRQIIRLSIGGEKLRLTLSNEYGETPIEIGKVHIANAVVTAASDIAPKTDTTVTFAGSENVKVPAGGRVTSDPVDINVQPLTRIAVTAYIVKVPSKLTCHVKARAATFITPGNAVTEKTLDDATICDHWFMLSSVDVLTSDINSALVILGDSITDGFGVENEQYTRWTDVLATKLIKNPKTRHLSVVNMGIGTNKLLKQENPPAAQMRFKRDVLDVAGVGCCVFFIGVNDLLSGESAERITSCLDNMISTARAHELKVIACTILPFSQNNEQRNAVNGRLRDLAEQACLNGLFDFDMVIRDPKRPDYMLPEYDNDGIHPTTAAYEVMGMHAADVISGLNSIDNSTL